MLSLVGAEEDNVKWLQNMSRVRGQAKWNDLVGIAKFNKLHGTVQSRAIQNQETIFPLLAKRAMVLKVLKPM